MWTELQRLEPRVLFAAGDLDTTFAGGTVIKDFSGSDDFGFAVAVQNDGKVLIAGRSNGDFAVARFNSDGSADASFGTSGMVTTDLGSDFDSAYAIDLQSDGKILLAGQTSTVNTLSDFALVRYSSDGSLDTNFGVGGQVFTDFAGSGDFATAVKVMSDGRIVVAGEATVAGTQEFAVARYLSGGQLDPTFGKVTTAFAGESAQANSIAVLSDGSIVAAGSAFNPNTDSSQFAVVKYLASGQLDSTFGSGGKTLITLGSDTESAASIVQQSDGKLVLAGQDTDSASGQGDFGLARLNTNGSLDASFGSGGIVTTDFASGYDQAMSVVLQSDGKIVVAGQATSNGNGGFGVARYNTNGSLDTTFAGGKVIVPFADGGSANSVAIDAQGRLVLGGFAGNDNGDVDFALARVIATNPAPPPPPPPPPNQTIVLTNDPSRPGKQVLTLNGSAKSDCITFETVKKNQLEVRMNGKKLGTFANISQIVAYGNDGDDSINAGSSPVPVILYGGKGNDYLLGSKFADVLIGGDGNDHLFGNKGNDLIVGDAGKDDLHSVLGNDLLVGGSLSIENNVTALLGVLDNFKSLDSSTVVDDKTIDQFYGTPGLDVLMTGSGDNVHKLKK